MPRHDEDDLFQHTTMTFGEHLEELRVSLFKAVIALAVGFGIGLYFAPTIVQWIQSPLEKALVQFYSEEAVEYLNQRLPAELRDDPAMKKLVLDEGLQPEEKFILPEEMLGQLKHRYPETFGTIRLPEPKSKPAGENSTPSAETAKTAAANETAPAASAPAAEAAHPTKSDMLRVFVWRPLRDDERLKVKNFNVQESFMIYVKAAFLAGAVISSPAVFYFLWSFVAAGLYPHEKRYIHVFLPFSVVLFLAGACMAFFFVFPPVLNFFFGITKSMGQGIEPRISEWLSFVLMLPLGFGIAFQLPLVMLFLERIHLFTAALYLSKWRIAVLLMAIASMVLSPGGDPYSMLMMLVPLIGLYFGGIALCRWLPSPGGAALQEPANQYASVD